MFNEITVCVNDLKSNPRAATAACKLAERFNGRVIAVYIKPNIADIARVQNFKSTEAIQSAMSELNQQEAGTRTEFESLSVDFKIPKVWRAVDASRHPISQMICSDLIVANQPETDRSSVVADSLIYRFILETKRPVLMIPRGWDKKELGTQTLLGWNDSAEAMRATSEALDILKTSAKVALLDIIDGRMQREEYEGLSHIEEYLSHKRIPHQLIIDNADEPDQVLQVFDRHLSSGDFDLVVAGAYGHSRAGEIVMGGVTNHLIKQAPIPVLFAH